MKPESLGGRRPELDALRGLAAVSVLLFHTLVTDSSNFQAGLDLADVPSPLIALLSYTPLHIVWVGSEAVLLFFVLSGFVLARSGMRPGFDWQAYFPSRLVRLYLPVGGAVLLTWIVFRLVSHDPSPLNGPALDGMPVDYPLTWVLNDLTLLGGTSTQLGVLWSLQWEVVFSLLLPVYLLLGVRKPWVTALVALAVFLFGWYAGVPAAQYLPVFFVGTLLALGWERVASAFSFLGRGSAGAHLAGALLFVVSICGITSYFLIGRQLLAAGWPARLCTLPITLAGISLLIIIVQQWPPLRRLLTARAFRWLGAISFSLYLVHRPIIIAFAFAFHRGPDAVVAGVVTSLAVAVVFYWLVERPSHRVSRRTAAAIRGDTRQPEPAASVT